MGQISVKAPLEVHLETDFGEPGVQDFGRRLLQATAEKDVVDDAVNITARLLHADNVALFLVGPGRTTLPIAILQYLEWKIDPTIAAVSVLQILFIGGAMLLTDRFVNIGRVV